MTRRTLRWAVAVLVTIGAFGAATWVCGALVLSTHDAGVRWGIAVGLGVAVAALAALWGHSYATADIPTPGDTLSPANPASGDVGATHNTIRGGAFRAPVIQGRDFNSVATAGSGGPPGPPAEAEPLVPTSPSESPGPGSGETRNTINGGTFQSPVIQGRDFGSVTVTDSGTQTNALPTGDAPRRNQA